MEIGIIILIVVGAIVAACILAAGVSGLNAVECGEVKYDKGSVVAVSILGIVVGIVSIFFLIMALTSITWP